MSSFHVKKITAEDTLPLRQSVLKPFLSQKECINPGDELTTSFHFGLFDNEKLISIATFIQEPHPDFASNLPYRLRGMATDTKYHRRGCGKMLLQECEKYLQNLNSDFIWFNARENAFPFYQNLKFEFHGPIFDIQDIGPHKVMYKRLIPG